MRGVEEGVRGVRGVEGKRRREASDRARRFEGGCASATSLGSPRH